MFRWHRIFMFCAVYKNSGRLLIISTHLYRFYSVCIVVFLEALFSLQFKEEVCVTVSVKWAFVQIMQGESFNADSWFCSSERSIFSWLEKPADGRLLLSAGTEEVTWTSENTFLPLETLSPDKQSICSTQGEHIHSEDLQYMLVSCCSYRQVAN